MKQKKLILKITTSAILAIGAVACESPLDSMETDQEDAHASGLKQLIQNDFVCDVNEDRIPTIKKKYRFNLLGGTPAHRKTAFASLANLPTEYLNYVFKRHKLPITLKNVGGSTRGATTSSNSGNGWYPTRMWIGQVTGKFNPLPHEMGHAMEHYNKYSFPNFQKDLTVMYKWAMNNSESSVMRGYAKSNQTEFWAEVFDSYYCSQESRDYMKEHMPRTLVFAQRYLISADDLEGTVGANSLVGKELQVDTDLDGVTNKYDKCADTEAEATVLFTAEHYGCSSEQAGLPDVPDTPDTGDLTGDEDGDGIPDAEDRCLGTEPGGKVWKDKTGPKAKWYGCMGGQIPNN
jgi:hypothetical protein